MDGFSNAFASACTVSGLKTAVFWNVEDLPFPAELTPREIGSKIKETLSRRGYGGYISIYAYSVKIDFSDEMLAEFMEARIVFLPQVPEDQCERFHRMLHDISFWALDVEMGHYCRNRLNLVVISNDIQGKITFNSRLKFVSGRSCYTLLSEPRDIPSGELECSLWKECRLLDYGKVMYQPSPSSYRSRDCTSLLKRKTKPPDH